MSQRCAKTIRIIIGTSEIILIHHTRCGMLAFTDDLLKAARESYPWAFARTGGDAGQGTDTAPRAALVIQCSDVRYEAATTRPPIT